MLTKIQTCTKGKDHENARIVVITINDVHLFSHEVKRMRVYCPSVYDHHLIDHILIVQSLRNDLIRNKRLFV